MVKTQSLFQSIRAHKWLVFFTIVMTMALINGFTRIMVKPYYSSNIDMIATSQTKTSDNATKDIKTYQDIVKTPLVLAPIHRELVQKYHYTGTMADLKNSIKTTTEDGSRVFTVTVTGRSPQLVRFIANQTAHVLQSQTANLVNPGNIRPLTIGKTAVQKHQFNQWLVLTLSLLVGILLAILLSIWRELSNSRVTSQYLQDTSELSVLSVIKLDKKVSL